MYQIPLKKSFFYGPRSRNSEIVGSSDLERFQALINILKTEMDLGEISRGF